MIGQYTDVEFTSICQKAPWYHIDYVRKTAVVQYGKSTLN